jgi:hypothetical protein
MRIKPISGHLLAKLSSNYNPVLAAVAVVNSNWIGKMQIPVSSLILLLLMSISVACSRDRPSSSPQVSPSTNSVVAFLRNAERQSETDDQKREIQRGLRDMLEKSPIELKKSRYADYGGQPNVWSITQLLQHYFVPSPLATLDEERFFRDFSSPEAREVIKRQLDEVTAALTEETKPANQIAR